MKKLIAICLSIIAVVSLVGCGSQSAAVPTENKVTVEDIESGTTGVDSMCKKMRELEYIPNDGVKMNAEIIGAAKGYRFQDSVNGSTMTVELYEFDTKNLSDTAKATIADVKEKGSFTIFGREVTGASMSENEKYMMVYADAKAEGDKPEEKNKERKTGITKVFMAQQ